MVTYCYFVSGHQENNKWLVQVLVRHSSNQTHFVASKLFSPVGKCSLNT